MNSEIANSISILILAVVGIANAIGLLKLSSAVTLQGTVLSSLLEIVEQCELQDERAWKILRSLYVRHDGTLTVHKSDEPTPPQEEN